jgi:2-amino-4-hydroxy-6-hydroxymethyldihydropteridine diphosphokinase
MTKKTKIAIGLGSNLGDREGMLQRAADCIAEDVIEGSATSEIYETAPWGILEQPLFLNAVMTGWTQWSPPSIVTYLKTLEQELGRTPGPRFGPRLIDLDLLVFGESVWESEGVIVPHPRLMERDFVLKPLAQLWPDWRHPRHLITAREGWERIREIQPDSAKDLGPLPLNIMTR